MWKGKLSKTLSVVLSASLLLGSITIGGGSAKALSFDNSIKYSEDTVAKPIPGTAGMSISREGYNYNSYVYQTYNNISTDYKGEKVVWTSGKSAYMYDRLSDTTEVLATDAYGLYNAKISSEGNYVIWKKKISTTSYELIGYNLETKEQVVISASEAQIPGEPSMTPDASKIGFVFTKSAKRQYAVYSTGSKELNVFPTSLIGASNNPDEKAISPILLTKDGNTAWVTHYYSSYDNTASISQIDLTTMTKVKTESTNDAFGLHGAALSQDETKIYGTSSNSSMFRLGVAPLSNTKSTTWLGSTTGNTIPPLQLGNDDMYIFEGIRFETHSGSLQNPGTYSGLSGDGNYLVYSGTKGIMIQHIAEFKDNLPVYGIPSPVTGLTAKPSVKGITLTWDNSVFASSGAAIYRDGALIASVNQKVVTYTDPNVAPGKTYTYDVRYKIVGSSESDSSTIEATSIQGDQVTLGNKTVHVGEYVSFGGINWRVFKDNTLLSATSVANLPFESSTASTDTSFTTARTTNIAYYLNSTFYPILDPFDSKYIKRSSWQIKDPNSNVLKTVQAYVGMLSKEDLSVVLPYELPRTWTLTPTTAELTASNYFLNSGSSYKASSNDVLPLIYLQSGLAVEGNGTLEDPYLITGEATATIPAPADLRVTATANSLDASWDSVSGATGYTLKVNDAVVYTGANLSYKATGLTPETTYKVSVTATNGSETSTATEKTVTTEAAATIPVPSQPTVLSTEAGNVKIGWSSVDGALIYKVQRNGVDIGSVATLEYVDKTAVEGETYLYTVKAFDGSKTSDASPFALVTVTGKVENPKAPSSPSNFIVVSDEHSVTTSWDAASGATGYKLVINNTEVYRGPDLSYVYTGLPEKTQYRVELTAFNDVGESGTQIFTIWTKDPKKLPAAKNPKGDTTHNEAVISWDAVEGAEDYYVMLQNDLAYEGTATSFTLTGLKPDRPYTVYIYARVGGVAGEPATLFIVTKKETVTLDKPANFVLTPKTTSVKATWDAVNGASGYKLMNGNSVVYQGPLTTFSDVDLAEGTTYHYSVVAMKDDVVSEAAKASTTTLVNQLPYPANLHVTDLKWNNVRFEWDAVEGADEYLVTRDGQSIGVPMSTWWSQDSESIAPGATYTYRVAAYKNGVLGKSALLVVTIPAEPIEGQAPTGDLSIKATRVYHDRVGLGWNTVTGATYYEVYQDTDYKIWSGTLNSITDLNVGPEETHTYKVVAGNDWGTLESNVVVVTTPSAPQSIVIAPSEPTEGTITFNYKYVEGSVMYVERNPQTKAVPVGDGTYHVTYYNSATGETRDEGIQTPVNGMLTFTETGIDPGKNYHYDITAVIVKADGTEEVVGESKVDVTAPADGSGVTVPGTIVPPTDPGTTEPGNGEGETPTPNPGTGNGGGTTPTNPTTPGTGGSATNPSTGGGTPSDTNSNGGAAGDGTAEIPGTMGGSEPEVNTDDDTEPTNPTSFSDIDGSFAKEAILSLSSNGIVKGYSDGTFGGKKKVTRAEFAIFLNRALGYTSSSNNVGTFKDFDEQAWYAPELNSALENGITKGFNDNTYRPNAFISREQAAIMLANVLLKNGSALSATISYVDQENIVAWAVESVNLVTQESVMSGYPGNKFLPKRELTREEAAQLIYNLITLK